MYEIEYTAEALTDLKLPNRGRWSFHLWLLGGRARNFNAYQIGQTLRAALSACGLPPHDRRLQPILRCESFAFSTADG